MLEEVFEEICQLFCESLQEQTLSNTYEGFKSHVEDNLPTELLLELKVILNVVDEDEKDEGGRDTFLKQIYDERFNKLGDKEEDGEGEEDESDGFYGCEVCERLTKLTRHHLYPRELHGKLSNRVAEDKLQSAITVCRMCHATIHRFFTNDELATSLHTLERLMDTAQMSKYAKWASKLKGNGRRVL